MTILCEHALHPPPLRNHPQTVMQHLESSYKLAWESSTFVTVTAHPLKHLGGILPKFAIMFLDSRLKIVDLLRGDSVKVSQGREIDETFGSQWFKTSRNGPNPDESTKY